MTARAGEIPAARGHDWWSADPYTRALRFGTGPLFLQRADGWALPLDVERWCARPDAADRTVLARCRGPVLDIGCGPGRLVSALAGRRVPVLGIDVSAEAVRRTRQSGGTALLHSVFEPLPREGTWHTGLLVDGNIGIGGDPTALLARLTEVLHPTGTLIVETAPEGTGDDLNEQVHVRLGNGIGAHGPYFPWSRVGPKALVDHAAAAGWTSAHAWSCADRRFLQLRRSCAPDRTAAGAGP